MSKKEFKLVRSESKLGEIVLSMVRHGRHIPLKSVHARERVLSTNHYYFAANANRHKFNKMSQQHRFNQLVTLLLDKKIDTSEQEFSELKQILFDVKSTLLESKHTDAMLAVYFDSLHNISDPEFATKHIALLKDLIKSLQADGHSPGLLSIFKSSLVLFEKHQDRFFPIWVQARNQVQELTFDSWLEKTNIPKNKVTYVEAGNRHRYEVKFMDGKLYIHKNHPDIKNLAADIKTDAEYAEVDTSKIIITHGLKGASNEQAIFVIKDNKMYIGYPQYTSFHHSSFLAGDAVNGAGSISVKQGKVTFVSNASGHYLPNEADAKRSLVFLAKVKAINPEDRAPVIGIFRNKGLEESMSGNQSRLYLQSVMKEAQEKEMKMARNAVDKWKAQAGIKTQNLLQVSLTSASSPLLFAPAYSPKALLSDKDEVVYSEYIPASVLG